jgi:hypothetical protein
MFAAGAAHAQEEWSFLITPQIWATHVAKNGFAAAGAIPQVGFTQLGRPSAFAPENSQPVDALNPQWGLQFAAQKGRWTFAGSFQYVSFETRTDLVFGRDLPEGCVSGTPFGRLCAGPGERGAQEFVNTTRLDMDFGASYFFPDVSRGLDLSIGGGAKVIYASASREFGRLTSPLLNFIITANGERGLGFGPYLVCQSDDCSDNHFADRVKTKTWLYGATIPMSATIHLSGDDRWLLTLGVSPFIGAETRDDQNVVYRLDQQRVAPAAQAGLTAQRLDGTTLATGVTADANLRYFLTDALSIYTGMRVQYIKGHEKYLAYGPLFGVSMRFR